MLSPQASLEVVTPEAQNLFPGPNPVIKNVYRPIFSSFKDSLLIGGASLGLLFLTHLTAKVTAPESEIGWFVFYLSFAINFPHFLLSYMMLYGDMGQHILKKWSFTWAAVIVPCLILSALMVGLIMKSAVIWGYLVNAMFFFVGWHYVKQIFGGIVVTNARASFFYNQTERLALKINLFSLWGLSFFRANSAIHTHNFEGVAFQSLSLDERFVTASYVVLVLSAVALVGQHVRKFIRTGFAPAWPAIICWLSIYAWYLPLASHPRFMLMVPFFHSLQYLIFVYAFKRSQSQAQFPTVDSPEQRRKWLSNTWGYGLAAILMGGLLMNLLPKFMDQSLITPGIFGNTPIMFSALIFINIHHYFIDNVLWRGTNPEIKQHLFGA